MDNPVRLNWLDPSKPNQPFPPVHLAMREPNGLLAIGGDLNPARLLRGYAYGVFPWFNPDEPILWWCPDPRAVLVPDELHISRSLAKVLRSQRFRVTVDQAFDAVTAGCAAPRPGHRGTWLGDDMRAAYSALHTLGHAHSIEVWDKDALVGGLYGVAIGRMFYGESMFSRQTDASKVALVHLCQRLARHGFELVDCQVSSPHLQRLGAFEMSRDHFITRARAAAAANAPEGVWVP
jgi:leucyl/phenylalanyl-tRNA---protein transferase